MKVKAASTQSSFLGFLSHVCAAPAHIWKRKTCWLTLLGQWGRRATSKQHEIARVHNLRR